MPTKTRLLTISGDQAKTAIENAILSAHKKAKIVATSDGFTFTSRIALSKVTCNISIDGNLLTFSAKDAANLGLAVKVIEKLDDITNGQGWEEASSHNPQKLLEKTIKNEVLDAITKNETILAYTTGFHNGKASVLIATNSRVIVKQIGVFTESETVIGLGKISSISAETGMIAQIVKITTSNAEIKVEKIFAGTADYFVQTVRNLTLNQPVQPTRQETSPGANIGDLEKLADLHKSGILTDEEYAAAKAKALGI